MNGERWVLPELTERAGSTVAELNALERRAYEEAYKDGERRGIEAGYREGHAAAQAELAATRERLCALLNALAKPLEDLDEEVEDSLVALSVAIARQLVRRELRADPGQVVTAVREALGALPVAAREVHLYLHPQDATVVRDALALEASATAWQLHEDPLLERGGCRVETQSSRIDATLEGRLAAVVAHVLGGERAGDQQ